MKKLLFLLSSLVLNSFAMDRPLTGPIPAYKKRFVIYEDTEERKTAKHVTQERLAEHKRKEFLDYTTSPARWDPIENKETITAYYGTQEIGHITFSDNIPKNGESSNILSAQHGFIHSFEIKAEFRGFRLGFDLFKKVITILRNRNIHGIVWYAYMPLAESKVPFKELQTIFYKMVQKIQRPVQLSKGKISIRDGFIGRRMYLPFKEEPHLLPIEEHKKNIETAKVLKETISRKLPPAAIDFLKDYVQQEKKSAEILPTHTNIEFTQPIEDDLYENSFEIDLRTIDHEMVGQVTYGQEVCTKDEGAIHYFYISPQYLDQKLGYPLFKKAIDELLKKEYKKINWHASLQKGMTRESLHESIKYFAQRTSDDFGLQPLIDNDNKNNWIKLYLTSPIIKH